MCEDCHDEPAEACSLESHRELRRDRRRYEVETSFLGWQDIGSDTELELRNHRRCGSTMSDGTRV